MKFILKKYELLLLFLIILLSGFLRFNQLAQNPPGLYIDEASIGYNAYTIFHSGKDEYGNKFPLFFKSFGDYKMPSYIYAVAGSMAAFGKNEFAVRFPSALAGTLTILIFYLFIKKILELDKSKIPLTLKKYLPIVSSLLLSISMWHIHFSRGGFEVNLALFFYLLGLYLVLLFWENKKIGYLLSGYFLYLLSMYTYDAFRILSFLTWFLTMIILISKNPKAKKQVILAGLFFLLLCMPLIQFSFTQGGVSRFSSTSAFVEYPVNSVVQKILIYPMIYLKNYLSFFSFDFLFNSGDGIGRHQIPGFGLFSRWQFPFLILGAGWFVKQKKSLLKYIVLGLLLVTPIPAAFARPSPHSLRALLLVLPLTVIISAGLIMVFNNLKKFKKVFLVFISLIAIYEFSIYMHFYYYHYPSVNVLDWGAGYKHVVEKSSKYKNKYEHLIVDINFAPVYFHFYDDSLNPVFINTKLMKANERQANTLYISPYSSKNKNIHMVDQVYLPGPNRDVYAQFWQK